MVFVLKWGLLVGPLVILLSFWVGTKAESHLVCADCGHIIVEKLSG